MNPRSLTLFSRRFIAGMLALLLVTGAASVMDSAYAQTKAKKQPEKKENYHRPKPTRPIRPEIPEANRYQEDKVFLEKADSLYAAPQYFREEYQVVKGNVVFRQGGAWMYCDSAYYYPEFNSMDAFGNVKLSQGDTLFVYADKLFYNGNSKAARLRCGPTQPKVKLKNRNTTLTTDSLNYSLATSIGECPWGLVIDDEVNTLSALEGFYYADSKDADFYYDVVLVNNKDGYRLLSDTLYYNTDTHIASIVSPTVIEGKNDTILTSRGWYDTNTGVAELTSRSTIMHKDSVGNVTTLEGDSLIYDKPTRITRAYSYRSPLRSPRPMVLTDTANNVTLIGGFGMYNDSTRAAMATEYPLLIEYSRPDSLFLRADTIRTFMEKRTTWLPDSSSTVDKETHVALAYHRARFFNQEIQGVADSISYVEADSLMYLYTKPVVWSGPRQVYGSEIIVHLNDSTTDWARLPNYGMMGEHVDEDFYNQLTGKEMMAYFQDSNLRRLEVEGNVMAIFLPQENDSTYNKLVNVESSFMNIDMAPEGKVMDKLKMWPDVTGQVIPIFMVKDSQKYLSGFVWLEEIRPVREWYGDKWVWIDDLGEVPDALEDYFNSPPIELGRRSGP